MEETKETKIKTGMIMDDVPKEKPAMNSEDVDPTIDNQQLERLRQALFTRRRIPMTREYKKIGRNDPCPCGSGLKYKACCWSSGKFNNLK